MKNTYKITLSLIVVVILVLIVVKGTVKSSPTISIGAVLPQSGFGAYWGKPELNGVHLAEMDLKKKYGDDNVHIIIEDGQSAIPASVSAAQKLLNIDKVNGIYSEFSGPSSAVSPIAMNAGKILVYSTYNQKIVESNQYSVKTFVSFEMACQKFAQYLNDPTKKILIISSIGDAAPYCERALLKVFPRENVKMIDGFIGTDYRTVLLQNKSFAPDFIIPIMYEDGSYTLIKQKAELGFKANIFGYRQDTMTAKILKELPTTYTEGMLYFQVPIDEAFLARIKSAYPDMSEDDIQAASNGYQSIMALGNALANCPNGDAQCATTYLANAKNISYGAYKNASFMDRVLQSDITIGEIKGGVAVGK